MKTAKETFRKPNEDEQNVFSPQIINHFLPLFLFFDSIIFTPGRIRVNVPVTRPVHIISPRNYLNLSQQKILVIAKKSKIFSFSKDYFLFDF